MRFTVGNDWLLLRGVEQFTEALLGIFCTLRTPVGLTTLTDSSNRGHPPGRLSASSHLQLRRAGEGIFLSHFMSMLHFSLQKS